MQKLSPEAISEIADIVKSAKDHADDRAKDRLRAVEYYQGEMKDMPADKGRSSVVSRDVRATIKKVLPSVMRTILGNDRVVEYQPAKPEDEQFVDQATDYINSVVLPECDGHKAIEDAIHEALLQRNGILHIEWETKQVVRVSDHTGLTEDALAELVADDSVTVLEHGAEDALVDGMSVPLHNVTIKRIEAAGRVVVSAVPSERFLIHPDAVTLEDSVIVGSKTQVRRSDLVAMGYDRDVVMGLAESGDETDDDNERDARRDYVEDTDESHRPNDLIDYYDVYVRYDSDGDGIAELHHMCFGGSLTEKGLLHQSFADEVPYYDVRIFTQPHQWEGISLFDDTEDIQRIKTVLLRQTLDNIYWQNNPQPVIQDGVILNPDAVLNPEFGLPIRVRQGVPANQAYVINQVPFVAENSFPMIEYLDQEIRDRTGVTDAAGGLAPDALQNTTATATALIEQQGIGQIEMMVSTIARGLRRFFRGLLRLIVRHQDVPRTVRLRNEWVAFDPRHWNAEMDCVVNTGLGAGTRERDMMVMGQVLQVQERLIANFGSDNPFVTPENLFNSLLKHLEAAGLRSGERYFTKPDPADIQRRFEEMKNAPAPEMVKAQAQAQIEQMKMQAAQQQKQVELQAQMQLEQIKIEANRDKEKAQLDADMIAKQQEIDATSRDTLEKLQADLIKQERQLQWEREKFNAEMELRQQEILAKQQETALASREQKMSDVMANLQKRLEIMARPRRIVRDEMGEVSGVEIDGADAMPAFDEGPFAGIGRQLAALTSPRRVVRDENGEIIGLEPIQ
jgi:hypothetical protein